MEPLPQWPVKLRLIRPEAPRFHQADFVLVADCAPLACPDLHARFLAGRVVAIGCPKFGDHDLYREKLRALIEQAALRSIRVVYMEVPCCGGLPYLVLRVLENSDIPLETVMLSVSGEVLETTATA